MVLLSSPTPFCTSHLQLWALLSLLDTHQYTGQFSGVSYFAPWNTVFPMQYVVSNGKQNLLKWGQIKGLKEFRKITAIKSYSHVSNYEMHCNNTYSVLHLPARLSWSPESHLDEIQLLHLMFGHNGKTLYPCLQQDNSTFSGTFYFLLFYFIE